VGRRSRCLSRGSIEQAALDEWIARLGLEPEWELVRGTRA